MSAFSTVTRMKILYLCLGMMFWYGIEQVFLNDIMQDSSARAAVTIVFTIGMLLLDIPGGIIADKYGRRNALVIGCLVLPLSLVVLALSTTLFVYCVGTLLYAAYWSLCNGTVQALVYDHLSSTDEHHLYAKHQGSVSGFGYIGAAVANLSSGFIAHSLGLRAPYLLSLVPAAIALYIAITTQEGLRNKTTEHAPTSLTKYYTSLLRTIQRSPIAGIYALQWIVGLLAFLSIGEFGQVFILAHGVSTIELGILWAIVAIVSAIALHYAHRVQPYLNQTIAVYILILLALYFGSTAIGIVLFMLFYAWTDVVNNVTETELQHVTPSSVRATVISSVTFIGNIIAIPVILLFNVLQKSGTIFSATSYTAMILAGILLVTHIVKRRNSGNVSV